MLDPIKNAIGWLLSSLYALPPHNLGIAIIMMTAVVMLLMMPLTAKQVRSMVAMQKLQPEIKKLQTQYKDDRQKQSEEVMKFYKENQINPLAGCLPLVIQFPVWIALYQTLKEIPKHIDKGSRLFIDLCGNSQYFDKVKSSGIASATKSLAEAKAQGKADLVKTADTALAAANKLTQAGSCLSKPAHSLQFLGMDLRLTLFKAKDIDPSFIKLLPYGLLVAFVVATGVIQTRQTMARQKRQNPDQPINPQMQTMMRIMPVMNIMTAFFPVGVALYWGARNVWMIGQQEFVMNKFYNEPGMSSTSTSKSDALPLEDAVPRANATNPNTSKKKQQRRKR